LTIIEDTRNKIGQHERKNRQLNELGYKVIRSKLPAGDYGLLTDLSVVIDTKMDLQEIYNNLIGKSHVTFRNECLLCQQNGIKLIILCEHMYANEEDRLEEMIEKSEKNIQAYKDSGYRTAPKKYYRAVMEIKHNIEYPVHCLEDVQNWQNPRISESPKAMNGSGIHKIMQTMTRKYDVQWEFCDKLNTGKRIAELLGGVSGDR
jgi:hypothetical protein